MFLAVREIRRAKWRFVMLAGAVGLLVFLILFVDALTTALIRQFIGAIDNQSAQVLVYSDQARKNLEGSVIPPDTFAAATEVDGVGASGPLGESTFTVDAGGEQQDAVLFGYELGSPGEPTTLVQGRLAERDGEAVVSDGNEGDGFDLGDVVQVVPGGPRIEIVGLADDANYSVLPTMFTTFDTFVDARRARNPDAGDVFPSAVALIPADGVSPEELRDRVNAEVEGVEALTRDQAVSESPGVESVGQSLGTVVFLAFFVVVVVSGLFFLILTVQKAQALTLLRAVGVRAAVLVRALLVQITLIVAGGVLVGGLLAALLLSTGLNGLGASVGPPEILSTGLIVLVLSAVASLGAVRRVLRIEPVRATVPGGVEA